VKLPTMSSIFRVYRPYYPYDTYLFDQANPTPSCLQFAICNKSKDGKARKDQVTQNFWNRSNSRCKISHYLLLSNFLDRGISLCS